METLKHTIDGLDIDRPNANYRQYSREVVDQAIAEAMNRPSGCLVTFDNGDELKINLANVVGRVVALSIEENRVTAEWTLLNTPYAKAVAPMVQSGAMSMTSCGTGVVSGDGTVSDFTLSHVQINTP